MRRAFGIVITGVALCDLVSSCKEPTQITVEIKTDVRCDAPNPRLEWTEIAIGSSDSSLDGSTPVAHVPSSGKPACIDGYVGRLVVVPSGRGERIQLRVAAHVKLDMTPADATPTCLGTKIGSDCLIARRVATFVHQSSLTLPIFLSSACLGKTCPADQTCIQGVCRSADCDREPSLCAPSMDAGPPPSDAKPPSDAGLDVSLDAGPATCSADGDCRLVPSYCDGTVLMLCVCYAFSKAQATPVCDGQMGTCLIAPCDSKTARCVMGMCVAE